MLLSAYGAWHHVLNGWYLPHAINDPEQARESDAWDAELRARGLDVASSTLPEPYQSRRIRSLERIFDVDELRATHTIQATFERLALEDVVTVKEFATLPARSRSEAFPFVAEGGSKLSRGAR